MSIGTLIPDWFVLWAFVLGGGVEGVDVGLSSEDRDDIMRLLRAVREGKLKWVD